MAEEMIYDTNGNATGYTVDPVAVAAAEEAATGVVDLKASFASALNVGWWEGMNSTEQEIVDARTPDQIMDAFIEVRPEWTEALTAIKADEGLSTALHGALSKDPSMLDGLASMAGEGSGVNPQEMLAAVNDPMARQALTLTLNKIAEAPDDAHDFADFKELYDLRNDRVRAAGKMREMGIDITQMAGGINGGDLFSMLRDALMSPTGFRDLMNQLPELLGLTGEQAVAAREAFGMIGNYLDLCMGTKEDGFRAIANQYGDDLVAGGTDYYERISGQRDAEIAAQMDAAGQGIIVDPATEGRDVANTSLTADQAAAAAVPDYSEEQNVYDRQVATWTAPKTTSDPVPSGM